MGCYILVCLFLTISTASARVCFLPDSTDCGSSDVNIPDVPCKYYSCKEAGLKNEAYQTCYDERTYNNGGVNLTCKQVKCNISKSECEAQAKATSQSCKFDDASGCYYLGECKQCNKDLYDLKEPKSGSDWECDSCTGCDGTFYNCTAKEKECKDINPDYTSKCADTQIAEEVEGIKDSHGNQCYTCEDKPVEKNCSDINKDYKNINQVSQCENYEPVKGISAADGQCYKCEKSKVTITIALDATNTTVSFSTSASDSKGYTVKLSLNGGGNDGITYPVTVTEGRTATYFSSTYEPGDCDVYADNCGGYLGDGRETVSAASNLSVIINDQTVLNNLTTENEYLDMRYFIGKTYDTDNYIIKFVKVQTCSDIGYQTTPCSTGYKQIDYIQLPHEDCYTCSKCYKESSSGTVANKSTIYYYRADEPYKNGECASEMTLNVACNRVILPYKPGENYHEYRKLYINGKESMRPAGYANKYIEAHWYGDFMECNGCATVTCTFKYGDKKTITIKNVGGEEERGSY